MSTTAKNAIGFRLFKTPWGTMAAVARGSRLVGLLLPDGSKQRLMAELRRRWPGARSAPRMLPQLAGDVAAYLAGRGATFRTAVDVSDRTAFQKRVLTECHNVPAGRVVTYGELARRAGRPGAARAVGQTMAANPVPLIIPCHRVVSAGRKLGGFSARGGVRLKRQLLEHEGRFFCHDSGERRSR